MKTFLITNNPLVYKKLSGVIDIDYREEDLSDLYKRVRDKTHQGFSLLTHPLSGSVKPGETPYKTVMMREGEADHTDFSSVLLIESAIATHEKLMKSRSRLSRTLTDRQKEDFQIIDLTLIVSALPGAGIEVSEADLL